MSYRILIWSGPQARTIHHDAIDTSEAGDALLERIAGAGRAALGLPPRDARTSAIAAVRRHLSRAAKLLEDL